MQDLGPLERFGEGALGRVACPRFYALAAQAAGQISGLLRLWEAGLLPGLQWDRGRVCFLVHQSCPPGGDVALVRLGLQEPAGCVGQSGGWLQAAHWLLGF